MAFGVVPSDLREVFWAHTLNDIRTKIRLYVGAKHAELLQHFCSMQLLMSKAFGGESDPAEQPGISKPQSLAELRQAMKLTMGQR